jgi:hypothetical protein
LDGVSTVTEHRIQGGLDSVSEAMRVLFEVMIVSVKVMSVLVEAMSVLVVVFRVLVRNCIRAVEMMREHFQP